MPSDIARLDMQVLLVPTVAPWHQNAKFVWATFFDHTLSPSGIPNNVYGPLHSVWPRLYQSLALL